jgi:hypothetical protein
LEQYFTYKYLSILRCRTWCVWPEHNSVSNNAFCVSAPDSDNLIYLSIHLVSYEGRPRPELTRPQPAQQDVGPLVWNGKTDTGYWVGYSFVKAPKDTTKIELSHQRPLQGEIDIQLHIGAYSEVAMPQLKELASSISYSVLSYLNITLGELLVPVAPIQVRTLHEDGRTEFDNSISVLVQERRQFTPDVLRTALDEFVKSRLAMSQTVQVALDAAMRRYLTSLTEGDPIDKYCDLWEACEFSTGDIKAKGDVVSRIAEALTRQMERGDLPRAKRHGENRLQIRTLYQIRKDLVHNAIENPEKLEEYTKLLSAITLELIRFRLGLPYQGVETLENTFA